MPGYKEVQTCQYLVVGIIRPIQEEGHINGGCVCQLVQSHELHRTRQTRMAELQHRHDGGNDRAASNGK